MAEPIATLGQDNDEEALLRVKGSSNPSSLASAISFAIYDGKKVILRAIGAGAVNQAAKAVAIAGGYVAPRGLSLTVRIGFATVKMEDGEDRSAMVFYVIPSRG